MRWGWLLALAGCRCGDGEPVDSQEAELAAIWTAVEGAVLEGRAGGRAGWGLSAGDLDGDGTDELLVLEWNDASVCVEEDGCVTAWLLSPLAAGGSLSGQATAWFTASSEALSDGAYRLQRDMAFPGDLSGDGEADILLLADRWEDDDAGYDEDSRVLLLWSGPFAGEVAREDAVAMIDSVPWGLKDHAPCEVNGDGQPDLCTKSGLFLGPISGQRSAHQRDCVFINDYFFYESGSSSFVEAGDLFGEGVDNMVRSHTSQGWEDEESTRTWLLGEAGDLCARRETRGDPTGLYAQVVDGDIDGDGREDYLAVGEDEGETRGLAIVHDRDRTTTLRSSYAAAGRDSVLLADFDGDGQDDLAWSATGGWVSIFRGPLDGGPLDELDADVIVVGEHEPSCEDGYCSVPDEFARAMAAGDFDGDGRADLAIGAPGGDDVTGRVFIAWGGGL